MATRKYVSNIEASYFAEHQLHCLPEPPTTGSYKVGDIVISSHQEKETLGWVCIRSGEPGTWRSVADLGAIKEAIKELQNKDVTHDDLISALRQRLEKLYDELKNKNVSQDSNINDIDDQVQINTGNITKLLADVAALGGSNTSLGSELRESIAELTKKVNVNTTNIGENDTNIEELKGKVQTNTGNIDIHTSDISELKRKVDNNITNISNNKGDIDELFDLIAGLDIQKKWI